METPTHSGIGAVVPSFVGLILGGEVEKFLCRTYDEERNHERADSN